jgi:glucose/arabinose dehydrogenase
MIKKYMLLLLCCGSLAAGAQTTMRTRVVKDSLFIPWEIIWGPDNHIWMTQKNGYICRLDPANGKLDTLYREANTVIRSEGGMLGMALHPQFASNPYVYVAYNYLSGSNYLERIVRYTYNGSNALGSPMILVDQIPANNNHNGCRLLISGDKLFYSAGDAQTASNAQNMSSVSGKIHRINLDGTIPSDNPTAGSSIWSWGHRNPQGMVMANGKLYSSEHGNTSNDEVNVIQKGRNYGWPNVEGYCNTTTEQTFCSANNVVQPAISWSPTLAVCGIDYYDAPMFPELRGKLIMATLKDTKLYALSLNGAGDSVTSTSVLTSSFGRLRDVCISPAGRIYMSTSKSASGGTGGFTDQIIEIADPNATAVAEQAAGLELSLFPNPAGSRLDIRWGGKSGTFAVAGMDGRQLLRGTMSGQRQQISMEALPAGVYTLQVREDASGETVVRRFVRK